MSFFFQPLISFLSVFLQALKWHLSPLTIVSWLNVYMQVAYLNDFYEVLLPQYPQQIFIQIAEVSGSIPSVGLPTPPLGRVTLEEVCVGCLLQCSSLPHSS